MRGRYLLLAPLAALLLLAGCGGDNPEPQPLPRPTASSSCLAEPTPPVMPEAAKEKTKAGAGRSAPFIVAINYTGKRVTADSESALCDQQCTRVQGDRGRIEAVL